MYQPVNDTTHHLYTIELYHVLKPHLIKSTPAGWNIALSLYYIHNQNLLGQTNLN